MELWTEYEGRTIDGAYPLTKLLQPEGRSAFFATSNGSGQQTVIRLIESHFDDEEILGRWRGIRALDHPNLVRLKQFGSVVLDDTSLVYTVIEPVDANLAEIVNERRMTTEETRQLAVSVVAALDALHTNGFVHEHVATHTVLAVGETIKLRSDCIREAPEGEEGLRLKQRDVHDLAFVLLEALTQGTSLNEGGYALPRPFDEIVRRGAEGTWGLEDISRVLTGDTVTEAAKAPETVVPKLSNGASSHPVERKVVEMPVRPAKDPELITAPAADAIPRNRVVWSGAGLVAALLLGVVWYFAHGTSVADKATAQAVASSASESNPVSSPAPAVAAPVTAPATTVYSAPPPVSAVADGHGQWRVVAFTYNRQGQAQQKADELGRRHPDLNPQVFSPKGHAPYLVTIGGRMTKDESYAMVKKARREGIARDVYAQNYDGRG